MPDIQITVDGRPALTTTQAAARYGRPVPQMRMLLSARRRNIEPVEHLDGRTPLYDTVQLDELLAPNE